MQDLDGISAVPEHAAVAELSAALREKDRLIQDNPVAVFGWLTSLHRCLTGLQHDILFK